MWGVPVGEEYRSPKYMVTLRIMSARKPNAVESYRGEIHQGIWLL